jgi:hypothetical protein
MCTVEVVEVRLHPGVEYQYGLEYADDKTVLRSATLLPGQTPWEAMCSLHPLADMGNKENRASGTVQRGAACAEILVIESVWDAPAPVMWCTEEDEAEEFGKPPLHSNFQIVTLWDREEDGGQLLVETLERECAWLFSAHCRDEAGARRLFADDSIEIRTIARIPPQPPVPQSFNFSRMRACLDNFCS